MCRNRRDVMTDDKLVGALRTSIPRFECFGVLTPMPSASRHHHREASIPETVQLANAAPSLDKQSARWSCLPLRDLYLAII